MEVIHVEVCLCVYEGVCVSACVSVSVCLCVGDSNVFLKIQQISCHGSSHLKLSKTLRSTQKKLPQVGMGEETNMLRV